VEHQDTALMLLVAGLIAAVIGLGAWGCPRCAASLGFGPSFCSGCGLSLRTGGRPPAPEAVLTTYSNRRAIGSVFARVGGVGLIACILAQVVAGLADVSRAALMSVLSLPMQLSVLLWVAGRLVHCCSSCGRTLLKGRDTSFCRSCGVPLDAKPRDTKALARGA
jgi:predicted amidophosphoribosyltransferase